jgi:hypothetical protein
MTLNRTHSRMIQGRCIHVKPMDPRCATHAMLAAQCESGVGLCGVGEVVKVILVALHASDRRSEGDPWIGS